MISPEGKHMAADEPDDPWAEYYQKVQHREPRELFHRLMALQPAGGNQPAARLAIDLGCGDGVESLALLAAGWAVLAIDQSPDAIRRVSQRARWAGHDDLQTQLAPFRDATLPPADLIYAGLSLPFCPPADFPGLWHKIRHALRPGATFAAHFFGRRDSWSANPEMTSHTADELKSLLAGLDIALWREVEEDHPSAFEAMKHFHYYEIIARQPAAAARRRGAGGGARRHLPRYDLSLDDTQPPVPPVRDEDATWV